MAKRKSVSENIFELLDKKGISQAELSRCTGIPKSTISDWKGKGNTPTSDKIVLIAKALKVKPEEILGDNSFDSGESKVIYRSDPLWVVIETYEKLEGEERKRLLEYVKGMSGDMV